MGRKKGNRLNDLTGAEWLYWTDTIYLTSFPPDLTHPIRKKHGAMKPPELMAEIISFFTKRGEQVLDPFAGVGGTLLGACLAERQGVGFEVNPQWVELYRSLQRDFVISDCSIKPRGVGNYTEISAEMFLGDCLSLMETVENESIDVIVTDPPYGCNHRVSGFKNETNFNMFNELEKKDFANASDLAAFLELIYCFGKQAWRVLKNKKYLIMMIGDRYIESEYMPLGFYVAAQLRRAGFKFKGLRIWCNKATQRRLKPYAVYTSFVPNITHQNILILKKEI